MEVKRALISVKTSASQSLDLLAQVLKQVAERFSIIDVSSVYKVNRPAESLMGLRDIRKEEQLEGLALVALIESDQGPEETLGFLAIIEAENQREVLRRSLSLNLLTFGSEIRMLPKMAIPHPEMHLRPEEVVLSAEVLPGYVHPVLNQSLRQLAQKYYGVKWGEFFAQGRPLIEKGRSENDVNGSPS